MSDADAGQADVRRARAGRFAACLTAVVSLLRGSVLLVSKRPGTPLRILCVVAVDMLYTLRQRKRLSFDKLKTVATLLDLGACVNTHFDGKGFRRREYRATRTLAHEAGAKPLVDAYLRRLRVLEANRPSPGGGREAFPAVRDYREEVARLSLELIVSFAFDADALQVGADLFCQDDDFEIIFRIVMLCQIMDDALDRKQDAAAGLPGFLTATASPAESLDLTRRAAASYRDTQVLSPTRSAFPFVVGLRAVSAAARCVLALTRRRLQ